MKETTRVLFVWLESDVEGYDKPLKEVIALFPDDVQGKNEIGSYSHIGQHGVASRDLLDECKDAKEPEYRELKKELEGLGYDLTVLNPEQENGIEQIRYKDYCVSLWMSRYVNTIQGKIDEPEIQENYYFWTERGAREYAEILIQNYDENYFIDISKNLDDLECSNYVAIDTITGGFAKTKLPKTIKRKERMLS